MIFDVNGGGDDAETDDSERRDRVQAQREQAQAEHLHDVHRRHHAALGEGIRERADPRREQHVGEHEAEHVGLRQLGFRAQPAG